MDAVRGSRVRSVAARAAEQLSSEATELDVRPGTARALFLFPLVGSIVVALLRLYKPLFSFLADEDSFLEWLEFLGYAGTAGLAGVNAFALRRRGLRLAAMGWFGVAAACLFIAGEEISWGQRILGFHTPDELAEINRQGEANIHNIKSIQDALNYGFLIAAVYGVAVPWAYRQRFGPPENNARFLLPPLFLTSAFLILGGYKLLRLTLIPRGRYTITKYGEWVEFLFTYALLAFAAVTMRLVRNERNPG